MAIETIEIRRLLPDGPLVLGDLLASCRVTGIDTRYDHPQVDIALPPGFSFPRVSLLVALYADGKYFGRMILGPDGLTVDPDSPGVSPYFKVEVCESLDLHPLSDRPQGHQRFG